MAMRGLEFPRKTIPPAANIGAGPLAESVMLNLCRTDPPRASRYSRLEARAVEADFFVGFFFRARCFFFMTP
jgi:hypothetical protein